LNKFDHETPQLVETITATVSSVCMESASTKDEKSEIAAENSKTSPVAGVNTGPTNQSFLLVSANPT